MSKPLPILRTSERRDFLRCQERWYWSWREGLKPLGPPSPALWFGSLVHEALALYYPPGTKRGPHPAETFARLAGDEEFIMKVTDKLGDGEHSITEDTLVNATELGLAMLTGYVEQWEAEDENWEIIRPEQTFQLKVPHPFKPGKFIIVSAGTYDLVKRHRHTGEIWIGEHKTAKAVITDHLPLDPQAGSYWLVASIHLAHEGLIKKGEKIKGIEYNFLRKALPDPRPRNAAGRCTNKPVKQHYIDALDAAGYITDPKSTLQGLQAYADECGVWVVGEESKNQPRPLFVRENVFRTAQERQTQVMRLQREALQMAPLRAPDALRTKNPNRDCQWDCDHYSMCLLHEQGGDWQGYKEAAYEIRDPYADHRKTTEGDD